MRSTLNDIKSHFYADNSRARAGSLADLASDDGAAHATSSRASRARAPIAIDDSYYTGDEASDIRDGGDASSVSRARTCVLCITRGSLPYAERGSTFVVLRVLASDGDVKGRRVMTTSRFKTMSPVWNAQRDMKCEISEGDVLCADAYAGSSVRGVDRATLVGRGCIALSAALRRPGMEIAIRLRGKLERAGEIGALFVRSFAADAVGKIWKRVFYVRHGESKWNEAQRDRNIANMMRFDHPLTLAGVQQAQMLGSRASVACARAKDGSFSHEDANRASMSSSEEPPSEKLSATDLHTSAAMCASYAACTTCFVSPLTRAVQTACFLLQSHPSAASGSMRQVCLQSIREIKGVGGLDTVGIAQGDGILARAQHKVAELINEYTASQLLSEGVTFDANDAVGQWWTSETDSDSTQEVEERIVDFLETIRFDASGDAVIVVGHSLFLQQVVSRIAPDLSDDVAAAAAASHEANPFDQFQDMLSSSSRPVQDPFASRQLNDFDSMFRASNAEAAAFVPFTPSAAPVMDRIEERRSKMAIFEKLMRSKLCNAGCVALDLEFDESGRATLVDAKLVFGSNFV